MIVDDDRDFLAKAGLMLRGHKLHFASDAGHATKLLSELGTEVGVALVDLDLPSVSGFDLIHAIRQFDAQLPIVAMSEVVSESILASAKLVGATATLRKPITNEWMPVLNELHELQRSSARASRSRPAEGLTKREAQVLAQIASGKRTKEVAEALGISPKTAACHRTRIMSKLDAHNAAELTRHAIRMRLIGV